MASGDTLLVFNAHSMTPDASAGATPDTRNNHPVWDFDASTDEIVYVEAVMPRSYVGGGITVVLHWMASSATSGNAVWSVAFERHDDDAVDLDSDSFATANTATDACASATGEVAYTSIAFTDGAQIDSIAAGESFRLKISRLGSNGSDNMSGDAELLTVELKET